MQLLFNTIMLEPNRWTDHKQLTVPLVDLLTWVQAAGFENLEIWQYHISSLGRSGMDDVVGRVSDLNMQVPALGAYPQFHLSGKEAKVVQARLDQLVNYSALLGCSIFKIFPGRIGSAEANTQVWQSTVDGITRLAEALAKRGITLTLETHGGTLCDTLESTTRLLRELESCENIGICFQPYLQDNTDKAMATFDTLRDRICHVHLQNRHDHVNCLLEDGTWTDMPRFLPHIKSSGFDGIASLEFTEGIIPPDGCPFQMEEVIANAALDRDFFLRTWG